MTEIKKDRTANSGCIQLHRLIRRRMNPRNFFAELKRRNVYKVAVAYAVVSWLVLQAASLFLATFEAPPWAMKLFVVAVVLGFSLALVLAWPFDLTPEGIRRETEIEAGRSVTGQAGKKVVAPTIVAAL